MMPYHVLKLSSVQREKRSSCKTSQRVRRGKRCPVQKVPKSGHSLISSRQGAVESSRES